MEKEEIEKAKGHLEWLLDNGILASEDEPHIENILKYIRYLEQKESILDKVTDKLKEDIEIDKVEWYEDGKMIEKQSKAKNVNRKEYAREILDIIDGGVKK